MNVTFRFDLSDEPPGKLRLARMVAFARAFQNAALRSAQAELSIPAFRRNLGDEARPEYRLIGLAAGSVGLTLESVQDRDVDRAAVTRHLDAVQAYESSGSWPSGVQRGELQAWGEVYEAVFRGSGPSSAAISTNGLTQHIDSAIATALANASPVASFRHIECIGDLHMMEVAKRPRFRINTEQVDLVFELTPDLRAAVDALRWQRVRAEGLWEAGSNRAQLTGNIALSSDPAGVTILSEEDEGAGAWLSEQLDRIASFANTTPGWDGPHSLATTAHFIEVAGELLRRISAQYNEYIERAGSPMPFPTPDGAVSFEWQVDERFISWELLNGAYLLLATSGADLLFEGEVGQRPLFQWIGWLLALSEQPI